MLIKEFYMKNAKYKALYKPQLSYVRIYMVYTAERLTGSKKMTTIINIEVTIQH